MPNKLTGAQLDALAALQVADERYRERKANARREALRQADAEVFEASVERADRAQAALDAGIPKGVVYQAGLRTKDAKTLDKLLELHRAME